MPYPPPLRKTNSIGSWGLVESWIDKCLTSHKDCKKVHEHSEDTSPSRQHFPARLIDIGLEDNYSDVRIVKSSGLVEPFEHVALSHCWGNIPILRLLKNNQEAFANRLPFEELPRTFKHAIEATRLLRKSYHIRYLWIDSLCIVQDDDEDWRVESTKMAYIYEQAFCTLAATASVNGNGGLFYDRNTLLQTAVWFVTNTAGSTETTYVVDVPSTYNQRVLDSPLLRRAWVQQERVMSRRVIHFCKDQIFWECLMGESSESQEVASGHAGRIGSAWKKQALSFIPHLGTAPSDGPSDITNLAQLPVGRPRNIYDVWIKIVHQYSLSKLTFPRDKLIAISAVAGKMHRLLENQDTYVAGLWKKYIHHQLHWQVAPGLANTRPATYRAPSWSWAAVDAEVHLVDIGLYDVATPLCKVIEVSSEIRHQNQFGEVDAALLRLSTPLARAKMRRMRGDHISAAIVELFSVHSNSSETLDDLSGERLLDGYTDIVMLHGNDEQEVYCIPLLKTQRQPMGKSTFKAKIGGLLLQRTANGRGTYQRCGSFSISQREFDTFWRIVGSYKPDASECQGNDHDNCHMISII